MIILIVGVNGTGKTYFRNNLMKRIPGYDAAQKTIVKLEPIVGDFYNLEKNSNTIVETCNSLNCSQDIRQQVDFVVFTSKNAFYAWFLNKSNGDYDAIMDKERVKLVEFTFGLKDTESGKYPHIVYDRAADKMYSY